MMNCRNPELLAPAGNMNTVLAAFDAGADAVYCGLKKFNARERTDNFSEEEMGKLISYARRIGKRVYVTFNTVIRESELDDAAEALAELDYLHPDALIVQDLGIVRMAREFFPGLTVHASTQMAVSDSAGIRTAVRMGVKRVILERQTTLEEIRQIMAETPVEVELFVHGALCCSISGICLLSSWIGGASGNRGKCKQSCRKIYVDGNGGKGYFLSTRDLAAFRLIPKFREMGIASLKIEGRLRRADYVSEVVTAYRTVLDAPEERIEEACREAADRLARTSSREPSTGFYTEKSAAGIIRKDVLGSVGRFCGEVLQVKKEAFRIRLTERLHIGDILRVQSQNGEITESVTVTLLRANGKESIKAFPGQDCWIACRDRLIPENGDVYKTGESFGTMEKRIASLPEFAPTVLLNAELRSGCLRIRTSSGDVWEKPVTFEPARKNPLSERELAEEFTVITPPGIMTKIISCSVQGSWFVPKSILKNLRRECMEFLNAKYSFSALREESSARAEACRRHHAALHASPFPETEERLEKESPEEMILPFFTPEEKLPELKERIRQAYGNGVRIFRASSLAHFELLRGLENVEIRTFAPLPAANSFAVEELASLGASRVLMHVECGKEDLLALAAKSVLPAEQYVFGRPVILATRASLPVRDRFSDPFGGAFRAVREAGLTLILPEKVFAPDPLPGVIRLKDLRYASEGENSLTDRFNFDRGLL